MFKYKLTIAYDGTAFGGWQIQPNALSIQQLIQDALLQYLGHPVKVVSSGRTDAGVHARGQVAHFETPRVVGDSLAEAVNHLLPLSIRILNVETVPSDFHARFSVVSKEYHYLICLSKTVSPFERDYIHHHPFHLDIQRMQSAIPYFIGTHDFTAFACESYQGSASRNGVRTLYRLNVTQEEERLRLEFEGNGFLYKMVRNITGCLLDIGQKKLSIEQIPSLFESKDRRKVGQAAPARGLFLMKVNYPVAL